MTPPAPSPLPTTTAPASSEATQRVLVLTVTGMLALAGLAIALAFNDKCADRPPALRLLPCKSTFGDRLDLGVANYLVVAGMLAMTAALYELRWMIRPYAVGAVAIAQVVAAVLAMSSGMPTPLVLALAVIGVGLGACAYGILLERRSAWAFAMSLASVLTVVFLFGSSKVQSETGWSMGLALAPAICVYYPLAVMLATSSPGARDR